ncbi:MAG: bifunctional folylpolyglutamate synthase/dihydrofolate synthase [Spirochaetaceae bacterium]|jgi:dihydrofolate synthase/folylpolyglutamate synthase|nr:bifunctional folylpolyglutamate synthase/dihydrofolate synthase [Spirochaetaceae bacterium]
MYIIMHEKLKEKPALIILQEWLSDYINYEYTSKKGQFSLDSIIALTERFGNPQNNFRSLHIAGSKGKGSVAAMTADIFTAMGLKTGLYTSPHIMEFSERVRGADGPFPEEIYERVVQEIIPLTESIIPSAFPGGNPSWFELVTLFCFLVFTAAGVEWGVFETGLGGRFDATNVLLPAASVITAIELEHTEYLGDTLEQIAFEKAGIIKPGVPVCIAAQPDNVREVFIRRSRELNAPLLFIDDILKDSSFTMTPEGMDIRLDFGTTGLFKRPLETRLRFSGRIQVQNAALAAAAIKTIRPEADEAVIEAGLSRALLPGRFEILSAAESGYGVPVVLDGAHTAGSIALTAETFFSLWEPPGHLLFACAADKDVNAIARSFSRGFSRITLTIPGSHKKADIGKAAEAFRDAMPGNKGDLHVMPDFNEAIPAAFEQARAAGSPLLVAGSFYLVAEVRKLLFHTAPVPSGQNGDSLFR